MGRVITGHFGYVSGTIQQIFNRFVFFRGTINDKIKSYPEAASGPGEKSGDGHRRPRLRLVKGAGKEKNDD